LLIRDSKGIKQRIEKGVMAERVKVYKVQESSDIRNSTKKEKEKDYD
jgi:hypothetical protein